MGAVHACSLVVDAGNSPPQEMGVLGEEQSTRSMQAVHQGKACAHAHSPASASVPARRPAREITEPNHAQYRPVPDGAASEAVKPNVSLHCPLSPPAETTAVNSCPAEVLPTDHGLSPRCSWHASVFEASGTFPFPSPPLPPSPVLAPAPRNETAPPATHGYGVVYEDLGATTPNQPRGPLGQYHHAQVRSPGATARIGEVARTRRVGLPGPSVVLGQHPVVVLVQLLVPLRAVVADARTDAHQDDMLPRLCASKRKSATAATTPNNGERPRECSPSQFRHRCHLPHRPLLLLHRRQRSQRLPLRCTAVTAHTAADHTDRKWKRKDAYRA